MATVDSTAPIADRPPRLSANPFLRVANDLRAEWRGTGQLPARARATSASPAPSRSPATRCRCCSAPTKSSGRSSACGCSTPRRLHARPGGQPLRHRRPPGELPLARVELRRPDPAARRRPADDRRRATTTAPGRSCCPPSTASRSRPRPRRWSIEAEAALATLRPDTVVDVYAWMRNLAMRIAMRALLGLDPDDGGKGAVAADPLRGGARLLRHRLRPAPAARPGLALAQADGLARRPRPDRLRGDRPPPRRPRLAAARTSSACSSPPAASTASASPTARSATR